MCCASISRFRGWRNGDGRRTEKRGRGCYRSSAPSTERRRKQNTGLGRWQTVGGRGANQDSDGGLNQTSHTDQISDQPLRDQPLRPHRPGQPLRPHRLNQSDHSGVQKRRHMIRGWCSLRGVLVGGHATEIQSPATCPSSPRRKTVRTRIVRKKSGTHGAGQQTHSVRNRHRHRGCSCSGVECVRTGGKAAASNGSVNPV